MAVGDWSDLHWLASQPAHLCFAESGGPRTDPFFVRVLGAFAGSNETTSHQRPMRPVSGASTGSISPKGRSGVGTGSAVVDDGLAEASATRCCRKAGRPSGPDEGALQVALQASMMLLARPMTADDFARVPVDFGRERGAPVVAAAVRDMDLETVISVLLSILPLLLPQGPKCLCRIDGTRRAPLW